MIYNKNSTLKKIYISTPIFYPNGMPHLGTIYTLLIGDVLSRFYNAQKYDVIYSTGTDEHGQKISDTAIKNNETPENYIKKLREIFYNLGQSFNINFNIFIGTHEQYHQEHVRQIWTILYNKGYIYKSVYKGWYCKSEETFYKESDLIKKNNIFITSSNKAVEFLEEEAYFFKLSIFKDKLIEFYNNNPQATYPNYYIKELLGSIQKELKDLCISRTKITWGIKVPNDNKHTIYVWFDALLNYLSILKHNNKEDLWENSIQILGKDILFFHGIVWTALLMALDYKPPTVLLVHGWILNKNDKMSKSLGNVINTDELLKNYNRDCLCFFLLSEGTFGQDFVFNKNNYNNTVNNILVGKICNFIHRVLSLIANKLNYKIQYDLYNHDYNQFNIFNVEEEMTNYIQNFEFKKYINKIIELSNLGNSLVEKYQLWHMDCGNKNTILLFKALFYLISIITKYLKIIMPDTFNDINSYFKSYGIITINTPQLMVKKII